MSQQPDKAEAALKFQDIQIKSDGTREGTAVLLNGKPIENLANLHLSFWNDSYGPSVGLDFSVRDPDAEPGTLQSYTNYTLISPNPSDQSDATLKASASCPLDRIPRGGIDLQDIYAEVL